MRKIDVAIIGHHHIRQNHGLQFLCYLRLFQLLIRIWDFLIEKLERIPNHLFRFQIQVPAFTPGLLQSIKQCALYAHGVMEITA